MTLYAFLEGSNSSFTSLRKALATITGLHVLGGAQMVAATAFAFESVACINMAVAPVKLTKKI